MKKQLETRKGFTIIEVVLVLAIAGLIFMMVFIALPALQRSQRDTQRGNDISRLATAINNFKSNNRGNIPGNAKTGDGQDSTIEGHTTPDTGNTKPKHGTWGYFYDAYLLVGSAGQTDVFEDPDGNAYSLAVKTCTTEKGGESDASGAAACDDQRYDTLFDEQSGDQLVQGVDHSILILQHATCDGEEAVYSSGKRNLALLYKYEGGGTNCTAI